MNKRFVVSVVVVLVLSMGLGYLVHGVLLDSDYGQLANLFRTQADQMRYIWLMPVANLFMAIGIVWVYQHGRQDKPFFGQGVRYGLAMAALIPVPKFLIYYVIQPVPVTLVVKQVMFDSTCLVITGVVLARLNK